MVENPPRRVLMKLSGEIFGGDSAGLDPDMVLDIVHQVAITVDNGVQIAIVIGRGNFFQGVELSQRGLDRARVDYMGILGTVVNVLALQGFLEQAGVRTRIQSAIAMTQVVEPYAPLHAIRHLEKGQVVVLDAGAGVPYFSTNTVSVQRTLETYCQELLMGKNGVDGVCTADSRKDVNVIKLDKVGYEQALHDELKVVDAAVSALCENNGLVVRVFGVGTPGNVTKALLGEDIGTVLYSENGAS